MPRVQEALGSNEIHRFISIATQRPIGWTVPPRNQIVLCYPGLETTHAAGGEAGLRKAFKDARGRGDFSTA